MTDTDKILQALARLEAGQLTLQETVNQQGNSIRGLQETVNHQGNTIRGLQEGQQNLDLKVEAFHSEQIKANQEILSTLVEFGEINARHTDQRLTRIEKHLNLPPVK